MADAPTRLASLLILLSLGVVAAQQNPNLALSERRAAEHDVPLLADVLELKPG
jgi:hypothetical protein